MLKNAVLMFIRRFYDPELRYADELIKQWVDSLIRLFLDLILYGFVVYFFLFGLVFIFPFFSNKIFLGNRLWHFPFIIILLGWVIWFIRGSYRWFRFEYKTKVIK